MFCYYVISSQKHQTNAESKIKIMLWWAIQKRSSLFKTRPKFLLFFYIFYLVWRQILSGPGRFCYRLKEQVSCAASPILGAWTFPPQPFGNWTCPRPSTWRETREADRLGPCPSENIKDQNCVQSWKLCWERRFKINSANWNGAFCAFLKDTDKVLAWPKKRMQYVYLFCPREELNK